MPIRTKLALTLAVPLVALLLRTAFEVARQSERVDAFRAQAELAQAAVSPEGLVSALEDERSWAMVDLDGAARYGVSAPTEGYDDTRRATDRALAAFEQRVEAVDPVAAAAFAPALDGMADLLRLRADIDADRQAAPGAGTTTAADADTVEQVHQRYLALVRPFLDATDQVTQSIGDTTLRRGADLVDVASRAVQQYDDLSRRVFVAGTSPNGVDERDEIRDITASRVSWEDYGTRLAGAAPPYDTVVAEHLPATVVADLSQLATSSLSGESIPLDELVAPMTSTDRDDLREVRDALSDEVGAAAERIVDEAEQRLRRFVVVAGVTLAAVVALTWLAARSVTRPLRSLSRQASALADESLPEVMADVLETPLGEDVRVPPAAPLDGAESDDVAGAVTTVRDTAVDLALEQAMLRRNLADSVVNLGRRSQRLIDRQLDFITRLENAETDPDTLADLFRLDHLATRMRRNAETLLVLAGAEPSRRWTAALPVVDVVRAAIGEVEDYQRVVIHEVEPATVLGAAAADLAHILAELIENGLTFSPADHAVDVRGRLLADGSYAVAVSDAGPGLDDEAMQVANRRLAGAESATVAPSRYLGHYVAGNLAARHGVEVRLVANPGGTGTTATVGLPNSLVGHDDGPVGANGSEAPAAHSWD